MLSLHVFLLLTLLHTATALSSEQDVRRTQAGESEGGNVLGNSCDSDVASLIQGPTPLLHKHQSGVGNMQPQLSGKVFVVFPGVSKQRRTIVQKNLAYLKDELGSNFECFVRAFEEGASEDKDMDISLFAPCKVEYNTDLKLFSSVKAIDVPSHADTVLFMLDDIGLRRTTFKTLNTVLRRGHVHVASVTYPSHWCKIMQPQNISSLARNTHYVEFNGALFRREAFLCLQSMINPEINPYGFGYAGMFAEICNAEMAVCDACAVEHTTDREIKEHRSSGPWGLASEWSYNHSAANESMWAWFGTLPSTKGWDLCSADYPSLPIDALKASKPNEFTISPS